MKITRKTAVWLPHVVCAAALCRSLPAQAQVQAPVQVEPALASQLTGISLPTAAARVQKKELIASVGRVLAKLAAQSHLQCRRPEVLMWSEADFRRTQAAGIIQSTTAQLKKAGYAYQDFGTQNIEHDVMAIFMLQRPKEVVLGYWQTSDDFLMLGWCQLVQPTASKIEPKPVTSIVKAPESKTPESKTPRPAAISPVLPVNSDTAPSFGGILPPMPVNQVPPVTAKSSSGLKPPMVKPATTVKSPPLAGQVPAAIVKDGPPLGTYECFFKGADGVQRSMMGDVRLLPNNAYDATGTRGRYSFDPLQKRIIWHSGILKGAMTFYKPDEKGRMGLVFPVAANEKTFRQIDAGDTWGYFKPPTPLK